jgi:two-component system phosphate regulon sensor histidine kinase PhoR
VRGDTTRLRQILVNLLGNAVKFTETGEIVLSLQANPRDDGRIELVFSVRDTGIGIPPEDLSRIFERFYRVDRSRSREMGGTGLGLSIVKHIVQNHGGTVDVSSTIGEGSTFTIRLPVARHMDHG